MGSGPKPKTTFETEPRDETPSEVRAKMATVTDEVALEEARLASIPSSPPHDPIATLRERLAPLDRVPHLAKPLEQIRASLDPRTAYILGFVDDVLPLETIVEAAGLPEREALEALHKLVVENVIVFLR